MKKRKLQAFDPDVFGKFEANQLQHLSSITGGAGPTKTKSKNETDIERKNDKDSQPDHDPDDQYQGY
jgi:hypothetical protein